jgi:F0F1-type ATP synthase delta subunit
MRKKSLQPLVQQLVRTLAPVTSEAEVARVLQTLIADLHAAGLGTRVREIEREIDTAWKAVFGAAKITVTTAHRLSEGAQKRLEKAAAGADVRTVIDGRLLGGALLRIDDRVLDGSLQGAITQLRHKLTSS